MQKGLTQKDLATALGYRTHTHIVALEAGTKYPTLDLVIDVARFFGVTADLLIDDRLHVSSPDAPRRR